MQLTYYARIVDDDAPAGTPALLCAPVAVDVEVVSDAVTGARIEIHGVRAHVSSPYDYAVSTDALVAAVALRIARCAQSDPHLVAQALSACGWERGEGETVWRRA